MNETCTIKEAMDLWNENHPTSPISRQTMYNWAKKFKWTINVDRVLYRQKMVLDKAEFMKFNANPSAFLGKK